VTQYATNPLFLFLTVWGIATAFYLAGVQVHLFPHGIPETMWAVLLNVATFSLGYLTWNLWTRAKAPNPEMLSSRGVPLTARRLKTSLYITLGFGLLLIGLCLTRLVILSRMFQVDLRSLVEHPTLCRRLITIPITPEMYAIRLCTIAITLTSSFFSVGFVLLGILLYLGRGWRRYGWALLFLLVSLSVGLLSLGRQEAAINFLFVILSYLFTHRLCRLRRPWEMARPLVVPVAILVALFVSIELLLNKSHAYHLDSRLARFLFSLYWYIAAPLGAFAEYLKHAGHTWTMGESLFFPVYKWLARLHWVAPVTKTVLTEWVYIPYPANVYTYLRDIHEDFGFVGLTLVPYVLGYLSAVLQRRAETLFPYLNLYLALLVLLIFSCYNYLLVSNQFYMQVVFALLLFRFQLTGLEKLSV
jgi:oligosaccharide repeat unit polymerase